MILCRMFGVIHYLHISFSLVCDLCHSSFMYSLIFILFILFLVSSIFNTSFKDLIFLLPIAYRILSGNGKQKIWKQAFLRSLQCSDSDKKRKKHQISINGSSRIISHEIECRAKRTVWLFSCSMSTSNITWTCVSSIQWNFYNSFPSERKCETNSAELCQCYVGM